MIVNAWPITRNMQNCTSLVSRSFAEHSHGATGRAASLEPRKSRKSVEVVEVSHTTALRLVPPNSPPDWPCRKKILVRYVYIYIFFFSITWGPEFGKKSRSPGPIHSSIHPSTFPSDDQVISMSVSVSFAATPLIAMNCTTAVRSGWWFVWFVGSGSLVVFFVWLCVSTFFGDLSIIWWTCHWESWQSNI